MARETPIEYPLIFTGVEAGVRGLGSLDAAYARNIASATKFDAEVQKAANRLTEGYTRRASQALVKNRLGLDDNTRSATSLRAAVDQLAISTERQARQTQVVAVASMRWSENVHRLTPAFSAAGAAISRIAPEIGGFSTAVGRAGGAISGFSAAFGGPWGIAIGAGVAGLGILAEWMRTTRDEAKNAAQSVADLEQELKDLEARRETKSRYAAGVRDAAEIAAAASGLDTQANLAAMEAAERKEFGDARSGARVDRRGNVVYGGDRAAGGGRRRPDPNDPYLSAQRRAANDAEIARLYAAEAQPGLDATPGRDSIAAKRAQNEEILRADQERFDKYLEMRHGVADQEKALDEAAKRRVADMRQLSVGAYQTIGSAGLNVFQALAKGQKVTLRGFLSGLGTEMAAEGQRYMILGGIRSLFGDPSGPAIFAAGSLEYGIGLGLGGATRGGGGGGGGRGGAGGRGAERATPISSGSSRGGDTGGSRTIILNMPTVVSPTAHDGVIVKQALREAERHGL